MDQAEQKRLEQEIGERLAAGQLEEAANRALRGYGPQILGYLVRVMGNDEDASEVYAQFCEDLWRGLEGFEAKSSFRTWAYHLARNARSRFWDDAFRRRGQRLETEEAAKIRHVVRTTTLRYRKTEIKDRFAQIRQELDPEERELLTLRVDQRMSWKEIARVLAERDEPAEDDLKTLAATLRQRFKRLHKKLRKMFKERGLLEEGLANEPSV